MTSPTTTKLEPHASVVSSGYGECRVALVDASEPKVRLSVGGVSVFFDHDDAHDIGVQLIRVAATVAASTPGDDREPTDDELYNRPTVDDDAPGSLGENDFRL